MKRYELSEGASNKFWEIERRGMQVVVRSGRIGGKPSETIHSCGSVEKAAAVHDALVRDKTKTGYRAASPHVNAKAKGHAKPKRSHLDATPRAKLEPRPKQELPTRKPFPASLAKKLDAAREELNDADSAKAALPIARKLLALVARAPYGGEMGQREAVEIEVLELLIEAKQTADATKLWLRLIDDWSAASPLAGGRSWYDLARAQRALRAKVPAKLRDRVRTAWAVGRLRSVYAWTSWPSAPKPPRNGATALLQAAAEIRHQQFERARACLATAREHYPDEAAILRIILMFEEGDDTGAHDALQELVADVKGDRAYSHWETLAALLVYLGADGAPIAKQVLAAWKKSKPKAGNVESSLFES